MDKFPEHNDISFFALIKHKSPAPHDDDTVPNPGCTAWLESPDKERRQRTLDIDPACHPRPAPTATAPGSGTHTTTCVSFNRH